MRKVVLIGASGFVGSAILKEALNRQNIQVVAAVRHPEKIKQQDKNLEIKELDVFSKDKITEIAKGADAVISAYNPGWTNPNITEDILKGYKCIIEGVKKSKVQRLLIVGGSACLYVKPGVRVVDAGMIPDKILSPIKASIKVYEDYLLPEKDLDWVYFCPAGKIEHGERTGKYRLGKDNLITDTEGNSKISVEDYAKAMIDELEKPVHHQECFTIGY